MKLTKLIDWLIEWLTDWLTATTGNRYSLHSPVHFWSDRAAKLPPFCGCCAVFPVAAVDDDDENEVAAQFN